MTEKQQSPWQDVSLLGIVQLVLLKENLLPRLEGRHPQVRAAGTAECISQVALARERKALSVIRCHFQVSSPVTWFLQLKRCHAPQHLRAQKLLPFYPVLNTSG